MKASTEKSSLTIKRVQIADLHNDPANLRLHDQRNLDAISSSLKTFGQVEPLVVQKGTRKVIGGNGRLAAMREMGLTECDVVEIDIENTMAVGLGIALNRTAELATWDNDALALTLESLQAEEFDLDAIGFTSDEIDAMLDAATSQDGDVVDDPAAEWQGMPECENTDDRVFRSLNVHFASAEDVAEFSRLIGQSFSDSAKYIWHPQMKMLHPSANPYVDEPETSGLRHQ